MFRRYESTPLFEKCSNQVNEKDKKLQVASECNHPRECTHVMDKKERKNVQDILKNGS